MGRDSSLRDCTGDRERPLLPPLMLSQGFSRPFSHVHANLLSCAASFLLLSTLTLCLTFSETLLYFRSKPWPPLMLFPFPVNSLLVVNLRALGALILQLFCQDNFPLPLLGANPLSPQTIVGDNVLSPACLPSPPFSSFVHIYLLALFSCSFSAPKATTVTFP